MNYPKDVPILQEHADSTDAEEQARGARALAQNCLRWKKEHAAEVTELIRSLVAPGASGSEQALAQAAAHDVVLLRRLGQAEVAIVGQIGLLGEAFSPTHFSLLVKALLDLNRFRTESARRASELFGTVETLAARRQARIAEAARTPQLRRVV
jgi:hypothetical protein